MHGWFCPIRLIHLIRWKSLHVEKKARMPATGVKLFSQSASMKYLFTKGEIHVWGHSLTERMKTLHQYFWRYTVVRHDGILNTYSGSRLGGRTPQPYRTGTGNGGALCGCTCRSSYRAEPCVRSSAMCLLLPGKWSTLRVYHTYRKKGMWR